MNIKNSIDKAFPTKTSKAIGICTVWYLAKKIWKMEILQALYNKLLSLIDKK